LPPDIYTFDDSVIVFGEADPPLGSEVVDPSYNRSRAPLPLNTHVLRGWPRDLFWDVPIVER
jgi:hypothetical protein